MKTIKISEYNPSMGILIDVQHPIDYKKILHRIVKICMLINYF